MGAACGEQAQIWNIDKATGLPDTENPPWAYDQPNVDFWHSATFSWDGKVANFIDESFGDGCPTVTTKTGGLPGGTRQFNTGNMYFFDTKSGDLLSEYRNPRPSNDRLAPEGGDRGTYCSSHLGIPVPSRDRYLLVNAFYRGGSSVIDFTDPSAPREIAFADKAGTNTWSAYTYPRKSGTSKGIPVYSNDGLSRNYGTAAEPNYPEAAYGFMRFRAEVGQDEPRRVGPPEPAAAGAGHQEQVRWQGPRRRRRARSPRARPRRTARATARRAPGRSSDRGRRARAGGPSPRRLTGGRSGDRPRREASVDHLLHRALRAERRRVLAWMLAGVLVTRRRRVAGATDRDRRSAWSPALLALWSVRQTAGLVLARARLQPRLERRRAGRTSCSCTTPTRARCGRCWRSGTSGRRRASGCPSRAASGAATTSSLELESMAGRVEVHEAWVDTGRARGRSRAGSAPTPASPSRTAARCSGAGT